MTLKTLKNVGEFGLLNRYVLGQLSGTGVSLGDDCGWMDLGGGRVLLASTDAMVEGSHYTAQTLASGALARKALRVALSDIAAMGGARSLGALVTLGARSTMPVSGFKDFMLALKTEARLWNTKILGGDLVESKGKEFAAVSVFGIAKNKKLLLRSAAKVGETLWVTGPLGLASAGVDVLRAKKTKKFPLLAQAQCLPPLRLAEGGLLVDRGISRCAMDLSDSLACSLRWIAKLSGVCLEVDLREIPIHCELARYSGASAVSLKKYILFGGEDYELIFSSSRSARFIQKILPNAYPVGLVKPGPAQACYIDFDGKKTVITGKNIGYEAFH